MTRARERSAELAERQREAAAGEERARERFERERERLREEVTGLLSDFRREGDDLLREIRSGAKSRRDLSQFQAHAAEKTRARGAHSSG